MRPFKILLELFRFFSLYADPFEKKVDRFLKKIRRKSQQDLTILVQEDLVKLSIFMEYKFKGYKKLKKSYRKKLYKKAMLIAQDFLNFYETHKASITKIQKGQELSPYLKNDQHFHLLLGIMSYLQPGQRLNYQESSNFEKLLRDPSKEKLIGDCNQIVTLYIYLFSLKYPVTELKVKILPDHVCLHYKDIDVETTSGQLAHYKDYTFIGEIQEIVATNLLDISDPTEKQFQVSAKSLLKSAEFAYQFSGHRATVEKNLFIAYHNVAVFYLKQKQFDQAILFAKKSGNTKLQKEVWRMQAAEDLKNKRYKKAAETFHRIGDTQGEKACLGSELHDLLQILKPCKTLADYKKHKSKLKRIKELAYKLGEDKITEFTGGLLKQMG